MTQENVPGIEFSDPEILAGAPAPETVERAVATFREQGMLRCDRAIPLAYLDEIDQHYRARYRAELGSTSKPDRRPLFTVDVEGPFNRPAFYANPLLFPIVVRLLGEDCILGACSSVVSFPGAPDQFIHRDSPSLYGDYGLERGLPPYALTILMPLVDANDETGSTEVWPTTHLDPDQEHATTRPSVRPVVVRGSVLLTDSRVVHRGAANRAQIVRPLVYLSYHRHWFRDFGGYENRPPIAITSSELARVPAAHKHLFEWRFDRYATMQLKARARRLAAEVVPEPLRASVTSAYRRLRG